MDAGAVIAGFRIERLIGEGSLGAVYEAEQLSLGRRVALRLIDGRWLQEAGLAEGFGERQRRAAAIHHPNLVPVYEIGEWDGGRFVAMRLIRGRSLADLAAAGRTPDRGTVEPVAGALGAAHAGGVVHGGVNGRNVLVDADGRAYLADLGLREGDSREADREALDALIAGLPVPTPARSRLRPLLALGAVTVAAAAAAALLIGGGESETPEPPPAPADTTSIGSDLGGGETESIGCSEDPNPNTPACTLAAATVEGQPVEVDGSGVIRGWAVRGASGQLALHVIRRRPSGSFVAAFSQSELVTDSGPLAFEADVGVRPGDRIGLGLGPGAVIGVAAGSGSEILRWDRTLRGRPSGGRPETLEGELMLRVDVEEGARRELPRQLTGSRAAAAKRGRVIAQTTIGLRSGASGQVRVVEVEAGIAIDLFRDGERVARLRVPDLDSEGELVTLQQACGGAGGRGFCLSWRNPGEASAIGHEYRVRESGRIQLVG